MTSSGERQKVPLLVTYGDDVKQIERDTRGMHLIFSSTYSSTEVSTVSVINTNSDSKSAYTLVASAIGHQYNAEK